MRTANGRPYKRDGGVCKGDYGLPRACGARNDMRISMSFRGAERRGKPFSSFRKTDYREPLGCRWQMQNGGICTIATMCMLRPM